MRIQTFALAIALITGGCQAPKTVEPTEPVPSESVSSAAAPERGSAFPKLGACDEKTVAAVNNWLTNWHAWHRDGVILPASDNPYVEREGERVSENTIFIQLTDALMVDGKVVARPLRTSAEMAEAFREEMAEAKKRKPEGSVMVAISANVSGEQLFSVMPLLEGTQASLAFAAPPIAQEYLVPTMIREIYPELYAIQRSVRSSIPADEPHECKPLQDLGSAVEKTSLDQRWSLIETRLGAGWVECKCPLNPDIPRYLGALTNRYENDQLGTAGNALDPTAASISVKATESWAQIATRVPATGAVWFTAAIP